MIELLIKRLNDAARLPAYAHSGHSGDLAADIYAAEELVIEAAEIRAVSTGIAIQFPPEYGAIVEDRSGLALRGVTTLAGVIDPGYRGELRVVLANLGSTSYSIRKGDRIAQLRLVRRCEAAFVEVHELGSSDRNTGGFGSTGI